MPWPRAHSDERGFTLIELLVTMAILMVGFGGSMALIDGANGTTVRTKEREGGTALARELLEGARSVPYARLTPNGLKAELQALPGLSDSTPGTGGWTVERRNQTYTVAVSVCTADDGQDRYGDHSGGGFCSDATANGDEDPDDYKRLTVNLQWSRNGRVRTLKQAGVAHNESGAVGPATALLSQSPDGGAKNEIVTNWSTITFHWRTSEQAAAIKYAVDGVVAQTVKPSGLESDFDWRIDSGGQHVPDGTYIVSATAFDDKGRPGLTRSQTVRLNRDVPSGPRQFRGGWNARLDVVDVDWNRNEEPDVTGYRVYRSYGATTEIVPGCNLTQKPDVTTCTDFSPPTDASVDYWVVALDEDPSTGGAREGYRSSSFTTQASDDQPPAAGTLTARSSSDDVFLEWVQPPPADPPYTGSAISFYRIYRDGTGVSQRYGRTSSADVLSFLDGGAAAAKHAYYVTAVDANYSESPPVGPVSAP